MTNFCWCAAVGAGGSGEKLEEARVWEDVKHASPLLSLRLDVRGGGEAPLPLRCQFLSAPRLLGPGIWE